MKLLRKELRLATSPLTWFFLLAALLTMVPGYPILLGPYFVSFGIFQSYQTARENQDILYSALLPLPKRAVVTAKMQAAMLFEGAGLLLMGALTAVRVLLAQAPVYQSNALMPANLTFLAFSLLIFAAFNGLFIRGFFKSAYRLGWPLIGFMIAAMLLVAAGEALWHFPGLEILGGTGAEGRLVRLGLLLGAAAVYALVTWASLKSAQKRFERIDL